MHITKFKKLQLLKLLTLITLSFSLVSCSKQNASSHLRLGYLLNASHAVPIVGLQSGKLSQTTGTHFLAGGYLINSLITGNIDLAYVGPGPVINALSKGVDLIILSGSAQGGNSLLLAEDFTEKTINKFAIPQYGNSQDLLAKILLEQSKGQINDLNFSQKLEYLAINPAELETSFFTKAAEAALVPEPWGSLLEAKGAQSISNPNIATINEFPSTLLIAYKPYFDKHQKQISQFIKEQEQVLEFIKDNNGQASKLVKEHLQEITKQKISQELIDQSMHKIEFSKEIDLKAMEQLQSVSLAAKYLRNKIQIKEHIKHAN